MSESDEYSSRAAEADIFKQERNDIKRVWLKAGKFYLFSDQC